MELATKENVIRKRPSKAIDNDSGEEVFNQSIVYGVNYGIDEEVDEHEDMEPKKKKNKNAPAEMRSDRPVKR